MSGVCWWNRQWGREAVRDTASVGCIWMTSNWFLIIFISWIILFIFLEQEWLTLVGSFVLKHRNVKELRHLQLPQKSKKALCHWHELWVNLLQIYKIVRIFWLKISHYSKRKLHKRCNFGENYFLSIIYFFIS